MSENEIQNTGPTVLQIDLSGVPDQEPPIRQGVRKGRILQVTVEENSKKTGFNVKSIIEVVDDSKEKKITSWIGTSNLVGLKRLWLSAGLKAEDTVNGFDITKLVATDVVIFVENELTDDKANPGQKIERSNIRQFLIPTDSSYGAAA